MAEWLPDMELVRIGSSFTEEITMSKNLGVVKRGGELLAWGLAAGILIAGCGGGGGSNAGSSGSALSDYIANSTGGSMNYAGVWGVANAPASATINVTHLTATATANLYNRTVSDLTLTGGNWNATPVTVYDLASVTGDWIARPASAVLQDSGDGRHATITPTGEKPYLATFTKTDLAGTKMFANAANCLACLGYGSATYPANAALYTQSLNVDWFTMRETASEKVTDLMGTPLTITTPGPTDSFCDPYQKLVFKPNGAPTGDNYNIFTTLDCQQANINVATYAGTVLVSSKLTGRNTVQDVLLITSSDPIYNNTFYATNGSNVWYGTMIPNGTVFKTYENSIAINAELAKGGYRSYP